MPAGWASALPATWVLRWDYDTSWWSCNYTVFQQAFKNSEQELRSTSWEPQAGWLTGMFIKIHIIKIHIQHQGMKYYSEVPKSYIRFLTSAPLKVQGKPLLPGGDKELLHTSFWTYSVVAKRSSIETWSSWWPNWWHGSHLVLILLKKPHFYALCICTNIHQYLVVVQHLYMHLLGNGIIWQSYHNEQRTFVAKMSKVVNTSFSKEFGWK